MSAARKDTIRENAQLFRSHAETGFTAAARLIGMKPNSSLRAVFLSLALAGAGLLALSGCASTNETGGKGKRALVCPQCKMVAVTRGVPYFGHGRFAGYRGTTEVYMDTCPGCQGAIETLFKEGKLKHKCSVCKASPFTCPVFHPIQ